MGSASAPAGESGKLDSFAPLEVMVHAALNPYLTPQQSRLIAVMVTRTDNRSRAFRQSLTWAAEAARISKDTATAAMKAQAFLSYFESAIPKPNGKGYKITFRGGIHRSELDDPPISGERSPTEDTLRIPDHPVSRERPSGFEVGTLRNQGSDPPISGEQSASLCFPSTTTSAVARSTTPEVGPREDVWAEVERAGQEPNPVVDLREQSRGSSIDHSTSAANSNSADQPSGGWPWESEPELPEVDWDGVAASSAENREPVSGSYTGWRRREATRNRTEQSEPEPYVSRWMRS